MMTTMRSLSPVLSLSIERVEWTHRRPPQQGGQGPDGLLLLEWVRAMDAAAVEGRCLVISTCTRIVIGRSSA